MRRTLLMLAAVLLAGASTSALGEPRPNWPQLLDRYAAGEYDVASSSVSKMSLTAFDSFAGSLERAARAWVNAGDRGSLDKRRLQAAAFMVEVAHASLSAEPATSYIPVTAGDVRYRLTETACELLRASPHALPGEGSWYLASFIVVARAGDRRNVFGFDQDPRRPSMQVSAASVPAATRALERIDPRPADSHLQHALRRAGSDARIQTVARSQQIDFGGWPQYVSELRSQLR